MSNDNGVTADPRRQLQQACAELQRRLRAGEPCRAEQFLETFPALAARPELALGLIHTEYTVRRQLGETPAADELVARFPQWREPLLRQLQTDWPLGESTPLVGATVAEEPGSAPPPAPLSREEGLGRYELLEELGRGGMGVVYKARDKVLGRLVALKTIRTGVRAGPDELHRFRREAQAVAQLHHPHIVPLYDFGEHNGELFFTMAYVAGGNLARHLDRYAADPRAAVTLVEKVARAVHAAHEKGIVHRDLKPGNVLLDERGEPLVGDFGLAKFVGAEAEDEDDPTCTGQMVGTPAYMAPEQAAGHGNRATAAADVWSLGVILYELLAGARPFPGQGKQAARAVLAADPPRAPLLRPRRDPALETIVLKCLRKEPGGRYASAGELAEDLARWLAGQPVRARPEPRLRRAWRAARRHPVLSAALLVAVLLLAGAPVARYVFDRDRPLRGLRTRLAAGQTVALLDDGGRPVWCRWPIHEGTVTYPAGNSGALVLASHDRCLLELLPDPPPRGYRFRVEVRHEEGLLGEVGLYFGDSPDATGQGEGHRFYRLSLNDQGAWDVPNPRLPDHKSHVALVVEDRRPGGTPSVSPALCGGLFDPAGRWRLLTVEVRPGQVRCSWDDTVFKPIDGDTLLAQRRQMPGAPAEAGSSWPPGGGLGLYVHEARASFRRALIEPLP
jgi:predicted Ser/Thr protein kinase